MPSKSMPQTRMMAGAAHSPAFAKKVGVPQKVAREFNRADKRAGYLKKGSPLPRSPLRNVTRG